ncbi:hypothetical protein [Bifidobacterium sp. SO1]|uniref:hypothetical protein n=1 Tax=Bifidobacterium sp. SO1 TaxID=2809029 RepID=UPI001BDC4027|nr:hypothetical protein [Bifidobacterium sp. SO1]MBT1161792.1 hypothetical protein [Bifidobacterium sp. SO1]
MRVDDEWGDRARRMLAIRPAGGPAFDGNGNLTADDPGNPLAMSYGRRFTTSMIFRSPVARWSVCLPMMRGCAESD